MRFISTTFLLLSILTLQPGRSYVGKHFKKKSQDLEVNERFPFENAFFLHYLFYILVSLVDADPYDPAIQEDHFNLLDHRPPALYEDRSMKVAVGNRLVEMNREKFKELMMTVSIGHIFIL